MGAREIDIGRRAMEAIAAHDIEGFLEFVHPEVTFQSLILEAEATTYHGHAGVRRWWDDVREVFPDWHVSWGDMTSHGDRFLVRIRVRGQGAASGVAVEQPMWQAVQVRDGKIVWWTLYRDEAEARAAVGPED